MRIERIVSRHYRQFSNVEVLLNPKPGNDLHIFIGKNGTGKTNILNAINWCLYGDEPHLSKESQRLPILSLGTIDEAQDGEDKEVMVEIQVATGDNKYAIFTRKAIFRVYKNGTPTTKLQSSDFEVKVSNEEGNTDILRDEEANWYSERFVPKVIREFFFFDGDRLDKYFQEATVQNIRHAIFVISQIELLENKIERRLKEILREIRKEAGRVIPKIDVTRSGLEQAEDTLENVEKQIEECKKQVAIARTEIRQYEGRLRGLPDIGALEEDRLRLRANKGHATELRGIKTKQKQDLLFEYGKIIMLWPAIKMSMEKINEKRKNKEIPPTIDKSLLERALENKACGVCGKRLDEDSERHVTKLLKEIRLSSEIIQRLLTMENPLQLLGEEIKHFEDKTKGLTHEIITYEKELEDIERKMNKIDKDLSGYAPRRVKEWHNNRKKTEDHLGRCQQQMGRLNARRDELRENIDTLKQQLNTELRKEKATGKLTKEMDFCTQSLDVVKKTKEVIMNETREKIESETKKLFFQLIWKKETFKGINIDEGYDIELIHSMGYECLGSISAAERELLALSFTLALHTVSGFDSPILIDTPVARISDEHRENFGKVLAGLSDRKQIILLFTPAEYSKDISKLLDIKSSNRFNCRLSSDEKEVKLEVI